MIWTPLDTWIVAIGILASVSCALVGNFLVLRRMSMMGDAISHAVLPGLAIAFFVTMSRGSLPMFIGAAAIGVLTAVFTQLIHESGRVEESASMGVVFTVLFAIGLILIVRGADAVDLDPSCVLYGSIELTPLNTVNVGGASVPLAVVTIGGVLLFDIAVIALFFKELNISSFDPALATSLGINARFMHYLLMTLVAVTTVAVFEAVGSILVIAMLVVPGAIASMLTRRLSTMLLVSTAVAVVAAGGGHVAAITIPPLFGFADTVTAGAMATLLGAMFVLVLLVAPGQGLVPTLLHGLRVNGEVVAQDLLGLLYRSEEDAAAAARRGPATVSGLRAMPGSPLSIHGGPLLLRTALLGLLLRGLVRLEQPLTVVFTPERTALSLTQRGREEATGIVRSHRLWEGYLHSEAGTEMAELHGASHALEHVTSPELQEALARSQEDVRFDPMGKRIPPGDEEVDS
jgi:manganese/zinc/iron transport system permease protein